MNSAELSQSSPKATTVGMAVGLLERNHGVTQRHVQEVVDDPIRRRQVGLALTGPLTTFPVTREEWVEREFNFLAQLHELGLPVLHPSPHTVQMQLNAAYRPGFGSNHRFIPAGLTREMLMAACGKAGIKMGTYHPSDDQTAAGIFECDLTHVMQPMDAEQRPFMLDYDEHETWSKDQGGDGLSSADEALYLILRMKLEFGHVLFMGGWIRCIKDHADSVDVGFHLQDGLEVVNGNMFDGSWDCGCLPRKFTALGP